MAGRSGQKNWSYTWLARLCLKVRFVPDGALLQIFGKVSVEMLLSTPQHTNLESLLGMLPSPKPNSTLNPDPQTYTTDPEPLTLNPASVNPEP